MEQNYLTIKKKQFDFVKQSSMQVIYATPNISGKEIDI